MFHKSVMGRGVTTQVKDVFATKVAHGRPADVTLADYIARKQDKSKLTFDEWFNKNWDWSLPLHREDIEDVWYAAQENM